ncbi:MAG: Hsp33 family molecular chaperone HslO, partial [Pseudomonadota bacterium]
RGRFVRLGGTVDRVLREHAYPRPISDLLGELMVLVGGFAGMMKFDGSFSLQVRGQGPVSLLVADCTNDGAMRGYASFDEDALEALDEPASRQLLSDSLLVLTVDQTASGGEIHQGIVEVNAGSLTDSMRTYFKQSEQVPTGIKVAIDRDDANGDWRGAAIIVQAMPTDSGERGPEAIDDWHRAMLLLETATEDEMLDPGLPPDRLLFRLFHEDGVRVFEPMPLSAACSCSEERVTSVLLHFDREELEDMKLEDGSIDVTCQFCNHRYHFSPHQLTELFRESTH